MGNVSESGGSAAVVIIMLVWLLIAVGILVWYLWAMARLFPRIGLKSTDGWIPIWNQWKLLERVGLPGWIVLLSFVGLGIIPTIMLIIAMHRLGREYGAGTGYTVLGVFIPPLWATLFANFVGSANVPGPTRGQANFAPAAPVATSPFAVNPQPGYAQPSYAQPGYAQPGYAQPGYAPPGNAQPDYAQPGYAPPPSPQGYSAPPAHSATSGQFAAPGAPQPPAPSSGFAAAQQPWAAGGHGAGQRAGSAAGPAAGAGAPEFASLLGGETDAEYDRLAAESFRAPPAAPLGQGQAPAAFSWTAARAAQEPAEPLVLPEAVVPPVHPLAAAPAAPAPHATPPAPQIPLAPQAAPVPPATPASSASSASAASSAPASSAPVASIPPAQGFSQASPSAETAYASPAPVVAKPTSAQSVQKATGITGMIDPLPASAFAVSQAAEAPMDLDHTVVAPRRNRPAWVLELPDGTELPLEDNVVVGRKPEPIDGSAALAVPDLTRTLSKSHVRLMREGERWLVEDLGSTNGLVLLNEDGSESELSPGVRAEATERMLFGTLEVRLRLGGDPA